jgi:hypothetical protein
MGHATNEEIDSLLLCADYLTDKNDTPPCADTAFSTWCILRRSCRTQRDTKYNCEVLLALTARRRLGSEETPLLIYSLYA